LHDRDEASAIRSAYLLDGRRVTLSDLVSAGLLDPGSTVSYERKSLGWKHEGTVTSAGNIRFADGQEFKSPSRAAAVAADVSAVDGWHAWVVDGSGRSLDALRQDLLSRVASQESNQGSLPKQTDTDLSPRDRYELLKQARNRADTGSPIRMSVRDLLSEWNASARGYLVNQRIDADLANHGLTTSPSFRAVTVETVVELITPDAEAGSAEKPSVPEMDGETFDIEGYSGSSVEF
jgi:Restriction Enzyme Adenine Methylase Associated